MTPLSDRLRELDEGATDAPWDHGSVHESHCVYQGGNEGIGALAWTSTQRFRNGVANATLIASLRNALPAIREVVRWSHEVLLTADDEPFDKLEAALAALDVELSKQGKDLGAEPGGSAGVEGERA